MIKNENKIHNTRQFQLLDKNNIKNKDYKKLMISLSIIIGLFGFIALFAFGIYIIKAGDYRVA